MNKRLTDIYFIRHAEPNYNNHDDMTRELSPKGMKDRELVTEFLADKQVDIVLSSPYKRAVDTVAHFASLHDLPVTPIFDFRERKVDSCWIDDFDAFTRNQWVDFNYKLTDGETLAEVQKRNIAALQKAVEQHKSKTIVVGSHGTALSTIFKWPGGKFCVSVFRQSQEYALERADFVKDPHGDQRPRQPESVCASTGVNADAGCRGILFQGDHPTLRSANMSSSWLSTKSQFWYRACQCFTMRCEAR